MLKYGPSNVSSKMSCWHGNFNQISNRQQVKYEKLLTCDLWSDTWWVTIYLLKMWTIPLYRGLYTVFWWMYIISNIAIVWIVFCTVDTHPLVWCEVLHIEHFVICISESGRVTRVQHLVWQQHWRWWWWHRRSSWWDCDHWRVVHPWSCYCWCCDRKLCFLQAVDCCSCQLILIQFSYSLVILHTLDTVWWYYSYWIQFGDITHIGYSLVILLIVEIGETSWRISRMMKSVILVWTSALSRWFMDTLYHRFLYHEWMSICLVLILLISVFKIFLEKRGSGLTSAIGHQNFKAHNLWIFIMSTFISIFSRCINGIYLSCI